MLHLQISAKLCGHTHIKVSPHKGTVSNGTIKDIVSLSNLTVCMCLCLRVCDSTQIYLHASSACVCLLSGLQVYENESRFVEGALWRSATCTRTLQTLSSVCLCVPHTEGMRRFSLVELLHAGLGVNIPSYCVCWNTHTNISNWLYRSSYIPNPFLSSFFCACTLVCLSVCCQPVSSYSTDVWPWGLPLLPTMLCYRLTLPRSAKKKKNRVGELV